QLLFEPRDLGFDVLDRVLRAKNAFRGCDGGAHFTFSFSVFAPTRSISWRSCSSRTALSASRCSHSPSVKKHGSFWRLLSALLPCRFRKCIASSPTSTRSPRFSAGLPSPSFTPSILQTRIIGGLPSSPRRGAGDASQPLPCGCVHRR